MLKQKLDSSKDVNAINRLQWCTHIFMYFTYCRSFRKQTFALAYGNENNLVVAFPGKCELHPQKLTGGFRLKHRERLFWIYLEIVLTMTE